MTGSQYKNVAQWTLANTPGVEAMDSASAARMIFNNLGVAFPNGSCEEILLTLMSEDYMGWTSCTCRQAQEYANAGVAAVGVDTDHVVVILPDESADSVVASADAAASASAKQTSEIAAAERMGMQFYTYGSGTGTGAASGSGSGGSTTTVTYPYVDIPQDGNIGTMIDYMGYHTVTNTSAPIYKLKMHARNNGRYAIANPQYYAMIDGRMVIATRANIGGQLQVEIGDYVQVRFKTSAGIIRNYDCIIGEEKKSSETNIWGHDNGRRVVEMVYHDYDPPTGYNSPKNDPWGAGRVTRITKVGKYGTFM